MFEQSDIHPYSRMEEEKKGLFSSEQKQKIAGQLRNYLSWNLVITAVAAFLLARAQILGGLFPFGLAFIAAQALRDRQSSIYALIGSLSALPFTIKGIDGAVQAGAYIILTSLVYFYPAISKRLIVFPILAAAVNIVVKGVGASFLDASDYNTMVILFESVLAGGLTPVFLVALRAEPWSKEPDSVTAEEYICFLLLVMALIMGIGDVGYQFITLKGTISRYCILLAAWLGGPGAGAAIGVLVGIIPSLSNMVAPSVVGNLAFSGLLAGAFKTFNKLGIIIGFILANMLLSIYYLNQPAVLGALVECIIAAVLLILTPAKVYYQFAVLRGEEKIKHNRRDEISVREMTSARLREIAEIFSDMARFTEAACEEVSDEERLNRTLNSVASRVCKDCGNYQLCWEHDRFLTYRNIIDLFNVMDTKGFVDVKHLNPHLNKRCFRKREMVTTIGCMYDNFRLDEYWKNKFNENRELLSAQMSGMAKIIQKLSGEVDGSIKIKQTLQNSLAYELEKYGLAVDNLEVDSYSDQKVEVTLHKDTCHGLIDCRKIVTKVVNNISGREFTVLNSTCSLEEGNKQCRFKLVPKGNLHIKHATKKIVKEGNVVSGDTVYSSLLQDGKQIFLLSDGMGSGPIAANESKKTVDLLKQLLETGFDKETSLKTVNAILLSRHSREMFSTVDLAIVDLLTSETDFVKVGAPASFIKRGKTVYPIRAQNPPIGVVNSFEVETISKKLQKGDYIVMLTDGALDAIPAFNKDEWLSDRLRELEESNPYEMVELLANKIIVSAGSKIKDDITILIAEVD